jgi:two-component system, NtrC family, sensor histidine kinase HydH
VTIRRTLLFAFLLIGLVPAILLAGLAFVKAREALKSEINLSLVTQADAMTLDLDKLLFERLENAATWSSLEVMQDVQVADVDKRLSNFLAQLKSGYAGIYRDLYVVDLHGRIVSASDAGRIGQQLPPVVAWRTTRLAGANIVLELPQAANGQPRVLGIRTPIRSQFGDSQLGELVLHFDWEQIETLLDRAAANGRSIAFVTLDGAVVASSKGLRNSGITEGSRLTGWDLASRQSGAFVVPGAPLARTNVLVGLAREQQFAGFAGLGLQTLVIQPEQEAFAPVRRMAWVFVLLLAALAAVTFWAASWISGALARPIAALTRFARGYTRNQAEPVPPPASGEVGELRRAFLQMTEEIELSQARLVRASKLAVVGEMSAVIAHEVRTPLGILRSSAQMLRREPNLSEEGRELMGFIESETERLNRLVSAMLDSARPRALNILAHDMHTLLQQSLALLAAQLDKHHLVVSENLSAADPIVECDAEQMTQVLLNLILNALQVLPEGGRLELASTLRDEMFLIDISDDGPGIPTHERERIFEAFFFKREGGVGLGLAIVQQIVSQHGGSIMVNDSRWGGANFHIELPRRRLAGTE